MNRKKLAKLNLNDMFLEKIFKKSAIRSVKKPFYITTTLPYVNANPHIGFALELVRVDVVARYKKLMGYDVFFNTGTDEHGQKIYEKAVESGQDVQKYVDGYTKKFKDLISALNISSDVNFIRTTDENHIESAKEFWKKCSAIGDIYKKEYEIKYCVGCELEKTDSELEDGKCPLHTSMTIEIIKEENYFFRFSKYQKPLLDLYKKNKKLVIPEFRFGEIKKFVERGLQDFSISRLKSKMPWGIEVPRDSEHVMYVWFDALVNYVSAVGWPIDKAKYTKWLKDSHGMVQYCGKDNLRQQSAMWQAMLMSAGLPNSKNIIINGFITGKGGVKMSKSLGNVVNPFDILKEYSTDSLRYYLLREVSSFEDGEFTMERFKDVYNANLANGLGNLASRIMKMAETNLAKPISVSESIIPKEFCDLMDKFELQKASDFIWSKISALDKEIQETQPFRIVKQDLEKGKKVIEKLVFDLYEISILLEAFLPETSEKIKIAIKSNKMFEKPLFNRKD